MSDLKLNMPVRGSADIEFHGVDIEEGWKTGDMKQLGVSICTVWHHDKRLRSGGCIDREQVVELRNFLNLCIHKWNCEDLEGVK